MSVLFIHPPLQSEVSGGNIFNRHIIQEAKAFGYPLVSVCVSGPRQYTVLGGEILRAQLRLVIWDSLLLDWLAEHPWTSSTIQQALLVHYLPSLNPSLEQASMRQNKHLENQAIRNCGRLIATGFTLFRILAKCYPDKALFLCRPGVDNFFRARAQNEARPENSPNIDLISVANVLPDKGYLDLLEALTHLTALPWTWHIAGSQHVDPAFSECFRKTAFAMRLIPRIVFHGPLGQERLALLLAEMDLFVQASRQESYGMALAEAVAAGLPVISTDTGAAEELIVDRHNGFLVPAADPRALQNALKELIGSPELRAQFRQKNSTRPTITWTSCFEQFKYACDFNP
ncbi:MAG: glycosyltransferase family 4 protein [Blastocatellia bacterium]